MFLSATINKIQAISFISKSSVIYCFFVFIYFPLSSQNIYQNNSSVSSTFTYSKTKEIPAIKKLLSNVSPAQEPVIAKLLSPAQNIKHLNNALTIDLPDSGYALLNKDTLISIFPQTAIYPESQIAWPARFKESARENIKYWDTEQGLPSTYVYDIAEDRDGNMWFATYSGICKYNGNTFTTWTRQQGLKNDYSFAMTIDSQNNIWIANNEYLIKFDGFRFTTYSFGKPIEDSRINVVYQDKKKNIWVGMNGGLLKIQNQKITLYKREQGLPENKIFSLCEDANENLWIGTNNGLVKFDGKVFQTYTVNEGLPGNQIFALETDRFNGLWVGTYSGICRIQNNMVSTYNTSNGLIHNSVISLEEDNEGNLWIGTNAGLNKVELTPNGQKIEYISSFTEENGLTSNTIFNLYNDSNGNLWMGTIAGGIMRLDINHVKVFRATEGLETNSILNMEERASGEIWLGTDGAGLIIIKDDSIFHYNSKTTLEDARIYALHKDMNDNMWLAVKNKLFKFDGTNFHQFTIPSDDIIIKYISEADSILWLSSSQGIITFNGQSFVNFSEANQLPLTESGASLLDQHKTLWFGIPDLGIAKIDLHTNRIEKIPSLNGLPVKSVNDIIEDHAGFIWIATSNGLFKFDGNNFTTLNTSNGLADNFIWSVIEDSQDIIWASTNKGLNYLTKAETGEDIIGTLNKNDGLKSESFNPNSSLIDQKGFGWWGSGNGLVRIDLNKFKFKNNKPVISLDQLDINDLTIDYNSLPEYLTHAVNGIQPFYNVPEELTLPPQINFLSFHFSARDWGQDDKLKYFYKLEGFDTEWHETDNANKIEYRNIPYGNFTFLAKATNSGGRESDMLQFPFTISTPWHLQWWAYFMYFISFSAILYSFYKIRTHQLKKQKKRLEQTVRERTEEISSQKEEIEAQTNNLIIANRELQKSNHDKNKLFTIIAHDLKSPILNIISLNNLLEEHDINKQDSMRLFEQLNKSAKRTEKLINNLFDWSRIKTNSLHYQPEEININNLITEVLDISTSLADKKEITLKKKNSKELYVAGDKYMLKTLLGNLVGNAIKFTPRAGTIEIELRVQGTKLQVLVRDSGMGMTAETVEKLQNDGIKDSTSGTEKEMGTGLGLLVCQEIIAQHGSKLQIESTPGKGSTFYFTLPLVQ